LTAKKSGYSYLWIVWCPASASGAGRGSSGGWLGLGPALLAGRAGPVRCALCPFRVARCFAGFGGGAGLCAGAAISISRRYQHIALRRCRANLRARGVPQHRSRNPVEYSIHRRRHGSYSSGDQRPRRNGGGNRLRRQLQSPWTDRRHCPGRHQHHKRSVYTGRRSRPRTSTGEPRHVHVVDHYRLDGSGVDRSASLAVSAYTSNWAYRTRPYMPCALNDRQHGAYGALTLVTMLFVVNVFVRVPGVYVPPS